MDKKGGSRCYQCAFDIRGDNDSYIEIQVELNSSQLSEVRMDRLIKNERKSLEGMRKRGNNE
ncbi:hypothetical protein BPADB04_44370 [Bacillus paranthracis]|nr:hypothetical protein BPADB04_44370 [Bacillus paranthracis]